MESEATLLKVRNDVSAMWKKFWSERHSSSALHHEMLIDSRHVVNGREGE